MAGPLDGRILEFLQSQPNPPVRPRQLAKLLNEAGEDRYPAFRTALKQLMDDGRVVAWKKGTVVLPTERPEKKKSPAKPATQAPTKAAKVVKAVKPAKAAKVAKPATAAKAAKPAKPTKARKPAKAETPAVPELVAPEVTPELAVTPEAATPNAAVPETPAKPAYVAKQDETIGTYRHNRKGFGFVIPSDPNATDDLFIGDRENAPGAITGDLVRAKVISRNVRDGKTMINGRIIEVLERNHTRFVGSLAKRQGQWCVLPDGNTLTDPIFTPDAATKYIAEGTKVVVEVTEFATPDLAATGVITEVLGQEGEKDVDLKTVIVAYGLPGDFPEEVKNQASEALAEFKATKDFGNRYDMRDEIVCTIDPDDAKDYDDAISLKRLDDGLWELGVHIADVSHFVPVGSPLDLEAYERGNSTYFPGKVLPMLPEVLSNGICSLMEGVPRLCKSAFIVIGKDAKPVSTRFSNTVIHSRMRLRYKEAQDLIDGKDEIYHSDGNKKRSDYPEEIINLLADMNTLAKRIQVRRKAAGQLNLHLPKMELVLDANGKVVDAVPEDDAFTHTLIEMFMVEANEAVARLLDSLDVPFLRRTHPDPDEKGAARLRHFAGVLGHQLPETLDRHSMQALLAKVKDRPEAFAINMAVLRSLSRAEYSPKNVGHFALASVHYGHFTSPIRRYADLTIHRLMDAFFAAVKADFTDGPIAKPKRKLVLKDVPTLDETTQTGRHISYTERRSEDAERELRQVKLLELMQNHIGEDFMGVVAGITNFGLFVQIQTYMVEGLIRYPDLMNDWWDVDEKSGIIRGQRSGQVIRIGDVCKITITRVDLPRRELSLQVKEVITRRGGTAGKGHKPGQPGLDRHEAKGKPHFVQGQQKRSQRSRGRDKKKTHHRRNKN